MSNSQVERIAAALPGYEIGHKVGSGAFADVFQARDRKLGRPVAIKQLFTTFGSRPDVQRRFRTEAQAIASLSHPNIVHVYQYVEEDDLRLMVMEYLSGGTLAQLCRRGALSPKRACAIALAACSALEDAHHNNILHRDIKPDNILFADNGTLKVADFGIAKVLFGHTTFTKIGEIIGTAEYMARWRSRRRVPSFDVDGDQRLARRGGKDVRSAWAAIYLDNVARIDRRPVRYSIAGRTSASATDEFQRGPRDSGSCFVNTTGADPLRVVVH